MFSGPLKLFRPLNNVSACLPRTDGQQLRIHFDNVSRLRWNAFQGEAELRVSHVSSLPQSKYPTYRFTEPRSRQMRRIDVTGRDPTSSSRVKYEKKRPPVTIGAYSHINTISAPVTAPDPESYGRLTEPSFVKKSLQEEIDDSIAYGHTPPKAPSSAGTAPFSFAQAVTASLIPPRAPRAMTSMDSMNTQATSNFPALSSISNNSKMSTPSAAEDTLKAGAVSKNEEPTKQGLSMGAHRQSADGALARFSQAGARLLLGEIRQSKLRYRFSRMLPLPQTTPPPHSATKTSRSRTLPSSTPPKSSEHLMPLHHAHFR